MIRPNYRIQYRSVPLDTSTFSSETLQYVRLTGPTSDHFLCKGTSLSACKTGKTRKTITPPILLNRHGNIHLPPWRSRRWDIPWMIVGVEIATHDLQAWDPNAGVN
jgi:hypothetical protein